MSGRIPPTVPTVPTFYLPSSICPAGTRQIYEPVERQRFSFRRYSIDEDGTTVIRKRNIKRERNLKPYERSSKPLKEAPHPDQNPDYGSTSPDANADDFAPLPFAVPRSLAVEIAVLIAARVPGSSPCPGPLSLPSLTSAACLTQSMSASAIAPMQRDSSILTPVKQEQPFSAGSSRGRTVWFCTNANYNLDMPPRVDASHGDLYIHQNMMDNSWQIWLFRVSDWWERVHLGNNTSKILHPTIPDRILRFRANGEPSWVTNSSYLTLKAIGSRKDKERCQDDLPSIV